MILIAAIIDVAGAASVVIADIAISLTDSDYKESSYADRYALHTKTDVPFTLVFASHTTYNVNPRHAFGADFYSAS